MGINIWLPIVTNTIIAAILVAGLFIGRKNGFLYELIKFISLGVSAVGLFFLNPILYKLVIKVEIINKLITEAILTETLVKAGTTIVAFLATYLIITVAMKIAKKIALEHRIKKLHVNTAKRVKPVGLTTKETKRLRKEQKASEKAQHKADKRANRKTFTRKSKIFGAIIGVICALVVGFFITMPLKPLAKELAKMKPELAEVTKGYEYTPYGQLDKLTNIVEIIIK